MKPLHSPVSFQRSLLAIVMLLAGMQFAWAVEFTGHHGGIVTNCKDPEFYHEMPGANAKVPRLERLSLIASENTVPESIVVLVNLEPVDTHVTQNGNGTFTIDALLKNPKTEGRAWVKVTAHSDDGCQQLHTWDIFVTPDGQ
jgi:hypothetical protein